MPVSEQVRKEIDSTHIRILQYLLKLSKEENTKLAQKNTRLAQKNTRLENLILKFWKNF